MCLSKVLIAFDQPSDLILDAWKVFGGTVSQPTFQMQLWGGKKDVPLNQWLKAEGTHDLPADGGAIKTYRPGFHVFADEPFQQHRRVYVRGVTCRGKQGEKDCLIATEMYVPSDPNGWPPKPEPAPKRKRGRK